MATREKTGRAASRCDNLLLHLARQFVKRQPSKVPALPEMSQRAASSSLPLRAKEEAIQEENTAGITTF